MAICSATSYYFSFILISKRPPLEIQELLDNTLNNQDKKVAFIQLDEDLALARYSEFMKKCHNMNLIGQTTGRDASSING